MTKLNERNVVLTDIKKSSSQYPNIAINNKKEIYVCWEEYIDGHDLLYGAKLVDNQTVEVTKLSADGEAFRPCMHSLGNRIWFVWAENKDRNWKVLARYAENGKYSETILVEEGEAVYNQSICDNGENIVVLWSRLSGKSSIAVMAELTDNQVINKEIVSVSSKAYRPAGCVGGDGRFYAAYDCFDNNSYNIVVRVKENGVWSDEQKVNNDEMWATQPIPLKTKEGVCVVWYDFGRASTLSYLSVDVAYQADSKFKVSAVNRFAKRVSWYQDMMAEYNKNGICITAYTWGKYNIHVRYRKEGQKWSAPIVMSYDDGSCAVHPYAIIDDENRIHLVWQFANKNGHLDRNASIVYNTITLDEFGAYENQKSEEVVDSFTTPVPAAKTFDEPYSEDKELWLKKNGYEGLKLVFGDIHGQSGISDGAGQIDQYYHFAKHVANLDFAALTDHDCYPDWTSKSEWEWMRTGSKLANQEDDFASVLAYEWTPNEYKYDYGHKNVYYPGNDGEMFRSGDIGGMTPFNLFESIKDYDGQCIPHHPAALWGMVSAATDWNFHDDKVQRLVEIFSRHAPYEDFESTSIYTKNQLKCRDCSAQDALARKYRLGFTAGSDSHQMEHGIEGGIVAAFVNELDQKNIYDAMYNRFVYGTSGVRILLSIKINNFHMGQELTIAKEEAVSIEISILGTNSLKAELVKNNAVVKTVESDEKLCEFTYRDETRSESDYYYIRVTQIDEHMAWSSPIWVDEK